METETLDTTATRQKMAGVFAEILARYPAGVLVDEFRAAAALELAGMPGLEITLLAAEAMLVASFAGEHD